MSAIGFLGLLVIAIIVLMLLMVKAKLHPVMSLECKSEVPYVIYSGKRTAVDTPQNAF